MFVAEEDGEIVGRLSVARDPHPASFHVADLGLMVVASHRRRGIGRALLQRAVEWAAESRVRKLELHVFPHNAPAIALYESFGFVREGYREDHYRRGVGYVDAILMAYRWTGPERPAGDERVVAGPGFPRGDVSRAAERGKKSRFRHDCGHGHVGVSAVRSTRVAGGPLPSPPGWGHRARPRRSCRERTRA